MKSRHNDSPHELISPVSSWYFYKYSLYNKSIKTKLVIMPSTQSLSWLGDPDVSVMSEDGHIVMTHRSVLGLYSSSLQVFLLLPSDSPPLELAKEPMWRRGVARDGWVG